MLQRAMQQDLDRIREEHNSSLLAMQEQYQALHQQGLQQRQWEDRQREERLRQQHEESMQFMKQQYGAHKAEVLATVRAVSRLVTICAVSAGCPTARGAGASCG